MTSRAFFCTIKNPRQKSPKNGGSKNFKKLDKNWKSSTLKDLRKIDKAGDVQHYPRSGRHRTVHVPDNISTIEDLILSKNDVFIKTKLNMIKWL